MEREQIIDEITSKYLNAISEYCDCVSVSLTFDKEGGTVGTHKGFGNWYARQGLAREFIEQDSARTHFDVKECEVE